MLTETPARSRAPLSTTAGVLAALYALAFFLGASLHLGLRIPLGWVTLAEPRIFPATTVEGLCALSLAVGAYAALTRKTWAWQAITAAHALALGGVVLGTVALAAGAGPSTDLNTIYHRLMLVALSVGLIFLSTPTGRATLGRDERGR